MGIASGAVNVRRYRITGELPNNYRDKLMRGIRSHAFEPIDPKSEVQRSIGWARLGDSATPPQPLGMGVVFDGNRLTLSMRIETLKPPPAEVKKLVAQKAKAREEETGNPVGRRERRVLKSEAEHELRQRILPRTTLVDLTWDLDAYSVGKEKFLYVWSTGKGACEDIVDLMVKSWVKNFGMEVNEDRAGSRALIQLAGESDHWAPTLEMVHGFPTARGGLPEQAKPDPDQVAAQGGPGAPAPDAWELDHLGREFLTWLVRQCEVEGGNFQIPGGPKFNITFGDKIVLRSFAGKVAEARISGEDPGASDDLRYNIAGGLTVREARLTFNCGPREYQATITEHFDIKGGKLPTMPPDRKADERGGLILDRIALLDDIDTFMVTAYGVFLRRRLLKSSWDAEMRQMREWLKEEIGQPKGTLAEAIAYIRQPTPDTKMTHGFVQADGSLGPRPAKVD